MSDILNQFVFFCFFALILFAALNDASYFRIPNTVSLAIVALFPLHVWASPVPVDWMSALGVAAAGFGAGFVMFTRGWLGGGDVKLLSATLLWAGSTLAAPQLLVMALVGGVLALGTLAVNRLRPAAPSAAPVAPKVPYGVAIAAGAGYAGMKLLIG